MNYFTRWATVFSVVGLAHIGATVYLAVNSGHFDSWEDRKEEILVLSSGSQCGADALVRFAESKDCTLGRDTQTSLTLCMMNSSQEDIQSMIAEQTTCLRQQLEF